MSEIDADGSIESKLNPSSFPTDFVGALLRFFVRYRHKTFWSADYESRSSYWIHFGETDSASCWKKKMVAIKSIKIGFDLFKDYSFDIL